MKKLLVLGILGLLVFQVEAQSKKLKDKPVKDLAKVDSALIKSPDGPPPGTTVIMLTPTQVKMLEDVIGQSDASFKEVNNLLQILRTQQYLVPDSKKDSILPKSKKDSVVRKSANDRNP